MTQPPYGQSSGPYSQDRLPTGPSGPRPKEVDQSFYLWIATITLGVVGVVVGFGQITTIQQEVAEQAATEPAITAEVAAQFAGVFMRIVLIGILVFLAVELLFAFKMRAGHNWARITLTTLGGLSVLGSLPSVLSPGDQTVVQLVLNAVSVLIIIGAIVLMYVGGANAWFQEGRPREVI